MSSAVLQRPAPSSGPGFVLVRAPTPAEGRQGLHYTVGVSAESAGATGIHLQCVTILPRTKARAHKHAEHETAIYALEGTSGCWFGEALEQHAWLAPGEYLYIAPDTPHLPYNPSASSVVRAVIARTDPCEQESVTLLPHLDSLPHIVALLAD